MKTLVTNYLDSKLEHLFIEWEINEGDNRYRYIGVCGVYPIQVDIYTSSDKIDVDVIESNRIVGGHIYQSANLLADPSCIKSLDCIATLIEKTVYEALVSYLNSVTGLKWRKGEGANHYKVDLGNYILNLYYNNYDRHWGYSIWDQYQSLRVEPRAPLEETLAKLMAEVEKLA